MDKNNNVHISVVVPVYGCALCIVELYIRLKQTIHKISENFEIILVNDCSPDDSWTMIEQLAKEDKRVKGIKFSRNFGQHHAISAGLDQAQGEWVVVMDCDLQDCPEEISKLYYKATEGYDIVFARRANRQDGFFKKFFSRAFYAVLSYLTDHKQDSAVANFGIYNKKVIQSILGLKENIRYFPSLIKWVGYKSVAIDVVHAERVHGETSYNLKKLFNLALNIILAYSDKPLRQMVLLGMTMSFISFIAGIYFIVKAILGDFIVLGYASLITSIWFLSGLIIFMLGITGLYIGKIFELVKNRPIYIVDKTVNV